ncbi:hypothetical protein R0381_002095 [Jeongeupia wiesaeckerbachi]|uniref:hypothetical protein n=1 Tax=Jeongeupia wiesaeckerbachi TaxID=3051218 RepID=UPI003D80147C
MNLDQSVVDAIISPSSLQESKVVRYKFGDKLSLLQTAEFYAGNMGSPLAAGHAISEFRQMSVEEMAAVRSIFDMYEEYLDVTFVEVGSTEKADIDFCTMPMADLNANGVWFNGISPYRHDSNTAMCICIHRARLCGLQLHSRRFLHASQEWAGNALPRGIGIIIAIDAFVFGIDQPGAIRCDLRQHSQV